MPFPKFVMQCARAFGACIEMRDDSLDAPIPEQFKPSNYHKDAAAKARKELDRLDKLNAKERLAFGVKRKAEYVKGSRDYYETALGQDARIDAMVRDVSAWTPPSPEHDNLKKFMLEQLETSRHGKYNGLDTLKAAEAKTPLQYYSEAKQSARREIDYHDAEYAKEQARANSNTTWVRALRNSLNGNH